MRHTTLALLPLLPLLFLPLATAAQTSCPVFISKVNPRTTQSWSKFGRTLTSKNEAERKHIADTPDFSVELRNASGKDIRGLKLQAAYYDATEDLHLIPIAWNASQSIKDGSEKTINWENEIYKDSVPTSVGWLVVVQKILFEDGSKWEYSDATPECYGEWWRDKKHPQLTKLPEQAKFYQSPKN